MIDLPSKTEGNAAGLEIMRFVLAWDQSLVCVCMICFQNNQTYGSFLWGQCVDIICQHDVWLLRQVRNGSCFFPGQA